MSQAASTPPSPVSRVHMQNQGRGGTRRFDSVPRLLVFVTFVVFALIIVNKAFTELQNRPLAQAAPWVLVIMGMVVAHLSMIMAIPSPYPRKD